MGAYLILRGLRPDVFAIVTNDSLAYVGRSRDILSGGLVVQGYRQIGYPLWIRFADEVRGLFGWDRLFAVVLLQRAIYVVAVVLIWRLLKWWSLPLLMIATTSTLVVIGDFVLTEGLSTPLSLLFSALLADLVIGRDDHSRRRFTALVALATATIVFLAIVKLQFAAFLPLLFAVVMLPSNRERLSRAGLVTAISIPIGIIGLLAVAQSVENSRELGVFEPVSERARAEWYGAWHAVFQVRGADTEDPVLADYFANGNLYTFLHGLEISEPSYLVRREILHERTASLFAAAGTSENAERWAAILGALRGGRTDDLTGMVNRALTVTPANLEIAYGSNTLAATEGVESVLRTVNEGEDTATLTTGVLAPRLTRVMSNHRPRVVLVWLGALAVCAMGIALSPRLRWVAASATAGVVAVAVALGMSYIDNARYLIPGGVLTMTIATLIAADAPWRRSVNEPSR